MCDAFHSYSFRIDAFALNDNDSLGRLEPPATTALGRDRPGMPVIDGEKWACSSCIKGHRVSGCTHAGMPPID